jgi:hypothetical protein
MESHLPISDRDPLHRARLAQKAAPNDAKVGKLTPQDRESISIQHLQRLDRAPQ